ncbi:M14 family metallopeptidase [Flavobacteriaceae bacterium S356]|uniref:M14 family metallopeptidase n=1 Tax=Asprobacillus argus TaxID=3076534 RepID=A0ABU3LDM6_9FLAO|nr:M14 family metallopeptidase [Flavobacteriaceae bacterium S356]
MHILDKKTIAQFFLDSKESKLNGRWIRLNDIAPLLQDIPKIIKNHIGDSEEERPIYSLELGNGDKKVLIWTQMHGNESTGTKAVFDLINFLSLNNSVAKSILSQCTVRIIPMLNPDGAQKYTRVNANEIDLNRDAVDRLAMESKVLRSQLEEFNPDFCFNLHDQRTIFGVEGTQNPATLSFLAPSEEETRAITPGRIKTMNVIVAMNKLLQQIIPGHIGRYTDEFYPTATGDNFQKLGFSTILIESGHYYNDYDREESRKFTFFALLQGVYHISTASDFSEYQPYLGIPNNNKGFLDIVQRNENQEDEAYQYEEKIINGQFSLIPQKVQHIDLKTKLFHNENDFVS